MVTGSTLSMKKVKSVKGGQEICLMMSPSVEDLSTLNKLSNNVLYYECYVRGILILIQLYYHSYKPVISTQL